MADATKLRMGICSVTFNAVDVGHTKGGVEVTYEPDYSDIKADQWGDTVVDKRLKSEKITAKVPLAESTVASLGIALPLGTLATNTINLGSNAAKSLLAKAATLLLHPIELGAATTDDITIYKAVSVNQIMLNYKHDEQRVIEVTFYGLIDQSKSDGSFLAKIG